MEARISVVMTVYNGSTYLREAVESILNQTYKNYEFIIIDDGSIDNSSEIIKEYAQNDKRIKLISRPNKGIAETLNEGVTIASGKYIAIMDQDDISLSNRFENQVNFLDKNPDYVAVGTFPELIGPEGDRISCLFQITGHENIDNEHMKGKGGAIMHSSVMIRKESLMKISGYKKEYNQAADFDMFLRLAEIGKLENISEVCFLHRVHPDSAGNSARAQQQSNAFKAVFAACERRNIVKPKLTSKPNLKSITENDMYLKWAWWAFNGKNFSTSMKYAMKVLFKRGYSIEAIKIIILSFLNYFKHV
ncbi:MULTISPECIES: glycosyltransferase [unclassified Methylophaga]|uniref:glycosyltransferase n=1 Tax=unclassified Methylophaga TaxID=2629249 RepID=UPI000C9944B5|nr:MULTISPECIES: glycosyltransferase [unclassified Methylophaga]MBN47224.1 glycosyl transferase family 2 [Methylophaga sp.]|tara:strand:- start:16355 stop:17269 length:915 start_codon:yes stop_codon:yes gene_type:complete